MKMIESELNDKASTRNLLYNQNLGGPLILVLPYRGP